MGKGERAAPVMTSDGFTINGCSFHVSPKYQPLDAIGQGSYGVVCSVLNTETNEKLAIKKITPMAGDEWDATHTLREIRLMRCLGAHENIISLKDLSMCQEKDELYMMMELADTDLHRLIQSSCPLTEGHIRVIMFQVLSGVKAMHDNGVLHRDLKPGNLLLNKDCELKITDFGLARMTPKEAQLALEVAPVDGVSPMTEYVVTRWYRPPELMLAPNGCYDGAVDMWSVGCILGELVSRKPLFPGTDFMDQLTRVFQVLPVPEPEARGYTIEKDALKFLSSLPPPIPGALEAKLGNPGAQALDLLRRMLCFNPKERISADEALAHPFFDGVQDEWGEIAPLRLAHSLEFAFEAQSLPLATLRQYICEEVRGFNTRQPQQKSKQSSDTTTANVTTGNNDSNPAVLENDYPAGSGFTLKACDFNVPPKYKPLQVLGEGSYGIVCAATDTTSKTNVAIKKITPMAGDEWDAKHTLREIRLMRYFGQHPNIASLQNLSTCIEKDELYLMMDLVDTDLHRLIQSKTKLEEAHVAAIMYQLLCGAQTLHENGVLHRDLKPGNILVSKNCDVKITDFGLSRYIPHGERGVEDGSDAVDGEQQQQQRQRAADKTQALMTEYVVTRWYRPPEIMLAPTGTYNEAVDMWSIGCIFGELLNRRPLFPGSDFLDQLSRVFSVLPVPPREKRGYEVEGDALAFLESLPPCSPSALSKTFRHASAEAVSLLRRLLCVNPARRISAKQALAHPYFKAIRSQLGEPPAFRVAKAFDFEFDYQDFSLAHLKGLIQSEVKLLQKDGLAAPVPELQAQAQVSRETSKPVATTDVVSEASQAEESEVAVEATKQEQESDGQVNDGVSVAMNEATVDTNETQDDRLKNHQTEVSSNDSVMASTTPKPPTATTKQLEAPVEPQTDDSEPAFSDSESEGDRPRGQQNDAESAQPGRLKPGHCQPTVSDQKSRLDPASEDEAELQQEPIHIPTEPTHSISAAPAPVAVSRVSSTSTHSRRASLASTKTGTSGLVRPKSAGATRRSSTSGNVTNKNTTNGITHRSQSRDVRDEDDTASVSSVSSNNRQHHTHTSSNNDSGKVESIERGGKWGHARAVPSGSSATARTTSSRLYRSTLHSSSTSSLNGPGERRNGLAQPSNTAARVPTTSRIPTSSRSNNQLSARGLDTNDQDSEKISSSRRPERVTPIASTSTAPTQRRQSGVSGLARVTPRTSLTASSSSSYSRKESLPEGWIRRTHSKSGREYFYDTLNKVSSWKLPSKHQPLDNIFAATPSTSISTTSHAPQRQRSSAQVLAGTSSSSSSPSDALTPQSYSGRGSGGTTISSSRRSEGRPQSTLPKDWARRTDPKTGRLFYVNLVTNRSYAKLPSAVSAAMLNVGREHHSAASRRQAAERKKATVPHSPQFSQMSWQRKRVPATDD